MTELKSFSNFRYNRVGGIDADITFHGEVMPTTLSDEQAASVDASDILPFDKTAYDAAIKRSSDKAMGISFGGVNISLNESNQNGLSAIKTALEMAASVGVDAFPLNFSAETAGGDKSVAINDIDEFNDLFVQFFIARQQFFK